MIASGAGSSGASGSRASGSANPAPLPNALPPVWVVDLDGVVWLAGTPLPGAAEAVARAREGGFRVVFVTNNAGPPRARLLEMLASCGIDAESRDLVTSAEAAGALLEPGSRAVLCAGEGVAEALEERGVEIVNEGPADAVVVGFTRLAGFDDLTRAMRAVREGAMLIGTNDDPTYPTPDGLVPGAGALLAAVATAAGTEPIVAGKPYGPMVELLRARLLRIALVVGDRPSTDGLLARALGAPFALVRSSATPVAPHGVVAAWEGGSLEEVVGLALAHARG